MTGKQLKNSILQWAIQGKLVPQDPHDEPASVLLEKIRQEKERLIKEKKIKRDKNASIIYRGEDNSYYEKFADGTVKCIDDEIPFEIPQGWEWCKLSNVIELLSGQDFIPEKYNSSNQGIPYITGASNIVNGNLAINRWTETPTVIGKLGDLLIVCKGSGVGKMCICNVDKIHIARQIQIIRNFSNAISLSYVKSVVEANLQTIISNAQGVIPGISREHILNLLIPLPPTNEQYEIDKKLQEILPFVNRYAKSQEALDKLNAEIFDKLRKSVLQEAIQGKLVPQDPNDEPASVLLEKIRQEKERLIKEKKIKRDKNASIIYRGEDNSYYEKFLATGEVKCIDEEIPFEVPKGWEWERWGNLSFSIQYGYNAPAEDTGDIRMVRISDIQKGNVLWATVPFCRICQNEIDTYLLKKNDILFARTGGTVGKSFLVNEVPYPSIYAGYLIRTRYSNMLSAQYMKYFMESELYWEQLRNGTIATAQPNCNGKTLAKMFLPVPPYNEQIRITDKLNHVLAYIIHRGCR